MHTNMEWTSPIPASNKGTTASSDSSSDTDIEPMLAQIEEEKGVFDSAAWSKVLQDIKIEKKRVYKLPNKGVATGYGTDEDEADDDKLLFFRSLSMRRGSSIRKKLDFVSGEKLVHDQPSPNVDFKRPRLPPSVCQKKKKGKSVKVPECNDCNCKVEADVPKGK